MPAGEGISSYRQGREDIFPTRVGLHRSCRAAFFEHGNNLGRWNIQPGWVAHRAVNGSGSQSSNTVLLRTIFQMGVPVSGKNLFPSNIAGLPTWFTIRASRHGYIGRKKEIDLCVAMNPETAEEDVRTLAPGAVAVYDEPLNLRRLRDDLHFYPVPFDKLVAPVCPEAKLRKLVRNMIYDGVLAHASLRVLHGVPCAGAG